ncbi:hypothetical protein C8T65DRAFT_642266 [Cerioporus squamosus]|nr:hypothetical protein C8T65DRAFT_642266 [Cerioporus squamosus]
MQRVQSLGFMVSTEDSSLALSSPLRSFALQALPVNTTICCPQHVLFLLVHTHT